MSLCCGYKKFLVTGILFMWIAGSYAQTMRMDSCGINDSCEKAILISNVISDGTFVCTEGCNLDANPGLINNPCGIGDFPTVWFKVLPDGNATLMNINVRSDDFDAPTITLFHDISGDCSFMQTVGLTQSNVACVVGSNGEAEAIGTEIGSNEIYYIAVSALNSVGGRFEICVNTISASSVCNASSEIEITARSEGGSLEGPFLQGETVSVCMKVNSYSAAGNGCQWFQGLMPFFGNGWDPSSFELNGQPLNATINGFNIGVAGNGLYGAATWDWFSDVGYHHDNVFFQVGDLDGNGTVEMCNVLYDVDCPNLGGLAGGCCGPCWTDHGGHLPPGWFAYGINGTCPTPGPPISVDWGDGNSCSNGMGPWRFCFDLNVREYPDCLTDPTTTDLTLGFFTTADGETGSWTGGPSVCALDQPIKRSFGMQCNTLIDLGTEVLPDICHEGQFIYEISEPGIAHWTWAITPSWAVIDSVTEGDNGYVINSLLHNQLNTPVTVMYIFTGLDTNTQNLVIKKVKFSLHRPIVISFVVSHVMLDSLIVCSNDTTTIILNAEPSGGTGYYNYNWYTLGTIDSSIEINPPFHSTVYGLAVIDQYGCTGIKEFRLIVDQNCIVNHVEIHNDESNDDPKKEDPPIGGVDVMKNAIEKRSASVAEKESIRIYPIPSKEKVVVEWIPPLIQPSKLFLYDTKGVLIQILKIDTDGVNQLQIDISNLNPGVYLVAVQSDCKINMARLIKL